MQQVTSIHSDTPLHRSLSHVPAWFHGAVTALRHALQRRGQRLPDQKPECSTVALHTAQIYTVLVVSDISRGPHYMLP